MALTPYNTIKQKSETEIIINKSRFISRAYPVETEQEALSILAEIRKKHYDATHNCYAYVVRGGGARFSDDGEPSGTAGMPMMEVLKAKQLTNTLVIVTRYFGGILLGAGGLVRAYSRSAADAVSAAKPVMVTPGTKLRLVCDYSRFNSLEDFIRSSCIVENIEYTENITLTLMIKSDAVQNFMSDVIEKSDGRLAAQIIGEDYMSIEE